MKNTKKIKEEVAETMIEDEVKLYTMLSDKENETIKMWDFLLAIIIEIRIDVENLKAGNRWNGHSWEGEPDAKFK